MLGYTLLLLVFVSILLSTSFVQTKLADYATVKINKNYGTDLNIGKINASFLGNITLKNVQIRDHHKDTLIFVKKLSTSLLSAKKVIDGSLLFDNITLENGYYYMKTYKGETSDNMAVFIDNFRRDKPKDSLDAPFILKFASGSASGCTGSIVGNPFDVCKTMQMADAGGKQGTLPQLMGRMLKEQGIGGFYRGISANMARATVLNGTKMACYDSIKGVVTAKTGWDRKDVRCMFISAVGAGFFMTCTVAPFDMLRTTLMNQPTDRKLYSGFVDAATKILKTDGPLAFYRGFFPIWGRFAPQATLQLIIFEQVLKFSGYDAI